MQKQQISTFKELDPPNVRNLCEVGRFHDITTSEPFTYELAQTTVQELLLKGKNEEFIVYVFRVVD